MKTVKVHMHLAKGAVDQTIGSPPGKPGEACQWLRLLVGGIEVALDVGVAIDWVTGRSP